MIELPTRARPLAAPTNGLFDEAWRNWVSVSFGGLAGYVALAKLSNQLAGAWLNLWSRLGAAGPASAADASGQCEAPAAEQWAEAQFALARASGEAPAAPLPE